MTETTNPAGADVRYPQVLRSVLETPWAILPRTLASIKELIALRATGDRLTDEEIQARIGAGPARKDAQRAGSVAVIPIYGVITPKADMFTDMSGGTSIDRLRGTFLDAVADESVSAIVFDVDSPGGQVDLVSELAAEIRAARGTKPILAVANTLAASAAYWLASQADEVFTTPSGEVGSIGVFAAHDDLSAALEKAGIKTTLISAGKFKTEANPFEPLSDEGRDAIQARVDDAYRMFVHDVARGRDITVDTVRDGFGEGRVVVAKSALTEGMVDGVATLQQVVDRAGKLAGGGDSKRVVATDATIKIDGQDLTGAFQLLALTDEAEALRGSAEALVERVSSLAEVKRGSLTAAKRDRLTACTEALRESTAALQGVLADTNPDNARAVVDVAMLNDIVRRHELHDQEVAACQPS